jgi:antitoxin (DNA-binding transcriptional repressor) of toxin-antitoxin stability system
MSHNEYRYVDIVTLRDDTKDILDGTHFLEHRYIVTKRRTPVAQIIPPTSDTKDTNRITVTDIRLKAREILQAVQEGKTFLVLRHGRADAIICPIPKEMSPTNAVAGDTGTGRDKLPIAATGTV